MFGNETRRLPGNERTGARRPRRRGNGLAQRRRAAEIGEHAALGQMCYMGLNGGTRSAGVRKARQDLTGLLDDVQKGREVVITERGRPVARLAPVKPPRPFPNLVAVRPKARTVELALARAVLDERDDRL